MLHDAVRCVVPGDRGWGDEGERDQKLQPHRTNEGEQELADAENRAGGNDADGDGSEGAGAGLMRPDADGDAGEGRQRVDGK